MNLSPKTLRRGFGVICLLAAVGMLVAGVTALDGKFSAAGFLLYWLGCFACLVLAMLTALADLRAVRRATRDEQRALLAAVLPDADAKPSRADPRR